MRIFDLTEAALLATNSYYEVQVNDFVVKYADRLTGPSRVCR